MRKEEGDNKKEEKRKRKGEKDLLTTPTEQELRNEALLIHFCSSHILTINIIWQQKRVVLLYRNILFMIFSLIPYKKKLPQKRVLA